MPRPRKRIPKSSVFASARSLPRLGPEPNLHPEEDHDWYFEPPEIEKLFPAIQIESGDPTGRYLDSSQHDARILNFKIEASEIVLTVNHFDVWRLASCFAGHDWKSYARTFPVTYVFEGVHEVHVLRCAEEGAYQKVRASLSDLGTTLRDVLEIAKVGQPPAGPMFRLSIDNRKSGGFRRNSTLKLDVYGNWFEILIHCSALRIDDGSWEGWRRAFGPNADAVFRAFDDLWPVNTWGVPDFEEWLEQFEHP